MAQLGKSEAMIIVTWPIRQPKASHDVLCQWSADAEMLLQKRGLCAICHSRAHRDKSANSGADCRWWLHLHSHEVYPQATQPETLLEDQDFFCASIATVYLRGQATMLDRSRMFTDTRWLVIP